MDSISLSWLLSKTIAALLLPPLNLLLLALAGAWLAGRHRRLGRALLAAGLGGLWLLSTPIVANALLDSLSGSPTPLAADQADAIVILGGGRVRDSWEYGGDTLGRFSLERVRYGALLARRLDRPVLVSGGSAQGEAVAEATIMAEALEREFGVPVRWIEAGSRNTRENARMSAELLRRDGVGRVFLVTHAWHLPRARPEFEAVGLVVIPAGTGHSLDSDIRPLDFLPSAPALYQSYYACHEWIGLLWYRIRD